jgi:DNA-binding transcriptional LysR family regulator
MPLKTYTVPVKFPPMRFYQLWHERVHQAPEHKWLRDQVARRPRRWSRSKQQRI